jgi:hypothetical protein
VEVVEAAGVKRYGQIGGKAFQFTCMFPATVSSKLALKEQFRTFSKVL